MLPNVWSHVKIRHEMDFIILPQTFGTRGENE
jgi:hypothetical protein